MGTNSFSRRVPIIFFALAIFSLVIACGSDDPAPAAVAAAQPTAEQVVQPTTPPAPAPTAILEPTAAPKAAPTMVEIAPISELEPRSLPAALHDDAERLDRDQVVALWTDFLGGSRIGDPNRADRTVTYYCSDGTGKTLSDPGNVYSAGPEGTFDWHVESRPGSRWNDVTFVERPTDSTYWDPFSPDGSYSWSLQVDGDSPSAAGSFALDVAKSVNCD